MYYHSGVLKLFRPFCPKIPPTTPQSVNLTTNYTTRSTCQPLHPISLVASSISQLHTLTSHLPIPNKLSSVSSSLGPKSPRSCLGIIPFRPTRNSKGFDRARSPSVSPDPGSMHLFCSACRRLADEILHLRLGSLSFSTHGFLFFLDRFLGLGWRGRKWLGWERAEFQMR